MNSNQFKIKFIGEKQKQKKNIQKKKAKNNTAASKKVQKVVISKKFEKGFPGKTHCCIPIN